VKSVPPVDAAVAILVVVATIPRAWISSVVARHRAREESRYRCLRALPPGSRVVDLGEHGMLIDVGGRVDREAHPHDIR
jgi:hypothetical protein